MATCGILDLAKDPNQANDLATRHPEQLDRLKKQLLQINASIMADGSDWHLSK